VLGEYVRAADADAQSPLMSSLGLLRSFSRLRRQGDLPEHMQAKVSVMVPVANKGAAQWPAGADKGEEVAHEL